MQFDIISIFPDIFDSYFNKSIIKRAQEKKKIKINIHDLRQFAQDKYKSVDDTPYGGGAGMLLKVEPIFKAVKNIRKKKNHRIILFSAKGKPLTQKKLKSLKKYDQLIFICGRYEGVDERVAKKIADEELSIGPFVLAGGEIPAMTVVEGVSRLIPGVLGNFDSTKDESFLADYLEYPQYTKPEEFRGWKVPKILLSGHHQKILDWRKKNSKKF